MAIAFTYYIDVTSGVGGGSSVKSRELIPRIFTTNPLVPAGSFADFTSADDVLDYFGSASEEYKRAVAHFGFVSKSITKAKKISFASYTPTAVAPRIYGAKLTQLLDEWKAISTGSITVNIGGTALSMTDLPFTAVTSLADVAGVLQTAIRLGPGTVFSAATVAWNATRGSFDFVGGETGAAALIVTAGTTGVDVASKLGWLSDCILSNGADAQTALEAVSSSAEASNNFASIIFVPDLTLAEIEEIAAWVKAQNVRYILCQRVTAANATAWAADLLKYGGVCLTLDPEIDGEYPEQLPATCLATTDYSKRNSTINYMYQQASLTPSVTTTTAAQGYDAKRVNYYGVTQNAGQYIGLYQRGLMMGLAVDPSDINTYANEVWFKDAMGVSFMSLLRSLPKISANAHGRSQLLTQSQSVINQALANGTISVGKELDATQKAYIAEITGSDTAWQQVFARGYWIDWTFNKTTTESGAVEWTAVYTLVYSKDDCIRKVEGSHVMI